MHANVHADRDKGSWRLPQDETLQVSDAKKQKSNVISLFHGLEIKNSESSFIFIDFTRTLNIEVLTLLIL